VSRRSIYIVQRRLQACAPDICELRRLSAVQVKHFAIVDLTVLSVMSGKYAPRLSSTTGCALDIRMCKVKRLKH
jgi:hypothetical protein